ncbi:MAG: phenylalanine--tRNA ligase subunit beta [bacterium]|nr:MAG: phenylalanine--tRNA ligase subunit beta [bacterium]
MKVTIDWLKKYVDFSQSPDEIAHALTMLGLEVDGVHQVRYNFENVVVGKIVKIKKHEQKQNLSICQVNVGKEILALVCGAPNVIVGIKVPVALVGARLPGDAVVTAAHIHGYDSPGMICSEAELGLSHQSEIIMVLNEKAGIGQDLKKALGRGEVVIEIDLTPNRPDCLGVIGVAREIGALNRSSIKKPAIHLNESTSKKIVDVIEVIIKNPESCPRYAARYIEGIKVGPSPHWLIQKLEAIGLRTINNVVDVTNYVMMETGQPLHAFDYDLLEDRKIIVRHAKAGEKFTTLDEKEYTLTDTTLLICDGKKPVALAGVMGGLNSEISNETTNVLLESAYFDPANTRKTAKSLGISTDSSQRFERGVDPEGQIYAMERAAQLIQQLAGGEVAQGYIDCNPRPVPRRNIKLRVERVNHLLGTSISKEEIVDILNRLEFKTKIENKIISVDVPSFRIDIEREVDLIEEVARIYGFDRINEEIYSNVALIQPDNKLEKSIQLLRDILFGMGYNEVLTQSLINYHWAEKFSDYPFIQLRNPISEELGTLRTSLIPGLLQVVKWNKNRYLNDQKLFEIGNIFYWLNKDHTSHHEKQKISLVRTGNTSSKNWFEKERSSTFYDLKGDIFSLLDKLKINKFRCKGASFKFLDNRALELSINGENLGYIGALSSKILNVLDIEDDIFIAELDCQTIFDRYNWDKKFQQIPKFPGIKRDISILIDQQIPVEEVEKVIWQSGGKFLKSVNLFDFYKGKQIVQNQKSLGFTLTFYSLERTLTEKEVDSDVEVIIQKLKSKLNAQLRA